MKSPRLLPPLILIILLGFGLRAHELEAMPLRGDEAFSVLYWADLPLGESLSRIAPGEPHAPLVYAVGRLWGQFVGGVDSVFALRYLSVLGNTLGMAALFALGWRLTGRRRVGLLAALMYALHPYAIWHSQEFRNYGYWAGMSAATLWLGLRLVDGRRRRADWLAYALAAAFTTLTIYTEPFLTIALAGFALLERSREWRFLLRLLLLQAAIGLLLLLGFVFVQLLPGFAGSYPGLAGVFAPGEYVARFLPTLVFGTSLPLNQAHVGPALSLVIALAGVVLLRKSRRQFRFVALAGLLPLALLGGASAFYDLFHPRYVLAAAPAFLLALVLGACAIANGFRRPNVALCLLLSPWFILASASLNAHFNDPAMRRAPAWDEMGEFLAARVEADDLVIQLSVDPAFGYYYRSPARELALPVNAAQATEDIDAALDGLRGGYESVYVVGREQAGWPNAGAVESWMSERLQEVMRTATSGLPALQFKEWTISRQFDDARANFGELVALVGFDFFDEPLPTGEWLLWLYWKPLAHSSAPLKSFAHIYDGGGALLTQDDQFPQRGRLDARTWRIGEVFRDVYYLGAAALSEGEYRLRVGWYDPEGGQRLRQRDGSDMAELRALTYAADERASRR